MTDEEKNKIDNMTHFEMAQCYRFAPIGHRYFDSSNPESVYFLERFDSLGGMTTEISKAIGWED